MEQTQLDTLLAIVDAGTFEGAARRLHVTPSAVSQRVRALESAVGQVVVRRTTPCRPTPAGEVLIRLARQSALLMAEARGQLAGDTRVDLLLALNADSLATWLRPVLATVATWEGVALRLHLEDQAHSSDLLRRGEVLGAVTSDPTPVQGCRVTTLGVMRYRPAATPALVERWRSGRGVDWDRMPVVVFNEHDDLQTTVLRERGAAPSVIHRVPSTDDFRAAVRAGLGWGMLPEQQLDPDIAAGRLVAVGRRHVDVPLHWMRWRLQSSLLDRVGEAITEAAGVLRRPRRSRVGQQEAAAPVA